MPPSEPRPRILGPRILAAGSLRTALTAFAADAAPDSDLRAELVFGPAGWLRERIAAGEACDLFLSANLAHPRALAGSVPGARVVAFAANRLVAIARRELSLTSGNLLARLLQDDLVIGTSTPGLDPGGDYADMIFSRAEMLVPGAKAALAAKARRLVGGRIPPVVPPGQHPIAWFLAQGQADVFLAYATTARQIADHAIIPLPAALAVAAVYGAVVLATDPARRRAGTAFVQRLCAPRGQEILGRHGFLDPAEEAPP